MQGRKFATWSLALAFALVLAATRSLDAQQLKTPEPPFQTKAVPAGATEVGPVLARDGIRIGGKFLQVSGNQEFTRFIGDGQELFRLDGRIEPSSRWAPFAALATELAPDGKSLSNTCPFDMMDGKKGVFRERVEVTPEGKIAMTFHFDVPDDAKGAFAQRLTFTVPTAFLLGKTIQVDDHAPMRLPESVESFVGTPLPKDGGGLGEMHTLFPKPRRIAFAPGQPTNTFALEFPPEVITVNLARGKSEMYVTMDFTKPQGTPFTIGLDPASGFLQRETDSVVGGINYTQNNGFAAPVFDQDRNLFINPSFESGPRYWKVSLEHGDIAKMLCSTDAHSGKFSIGLRNDTPGGSHPGVFKSVATNVFPDTTYTLSAWIKSTNDKKARISMHPRGAGGPQTWSELSQAETRAPHDQWQRVHCTFRTKPQAYNVVIWFSGPANTLVDDLQLEKGATMTDYAGNKVGMELLTDSPDSPVVDEAAPINARLLFRGEPGLNGSVEISGTDFFGHKTLAMTPRITLGSAGEQTIPLGPDSLFPKGTNVIKTVVKIDGQKTYSDFVRLIRLKYADNTARHKALQSLPLGRFAAYPDNMARLVKYCGIGASAETRNLRGRDSAADHAVMDKYGIADFWGGVIWSIAWNDTINGQKWVWNGQPVQDLESYPPDFLQWVEEMAYAQTKAAPWIGYWVMEREPAGRYRTLRAGNYKEYAKLVLAAYHGTLRANPDAWFEPFNVWNLFVQGRNEILIFLRCANELEPETRFKVIGAHTYRAFPENPDVEEDLLELMRGLARLGYPDIKIQAGEGSYYFPMIMPELGLAPWGSVSRKDSYGDVILPSYDLGWGERIGAAQVLREALVYYKHADRVVNNCSWSPSFLDNRTPLSWMLANSALVDILGNADFKEDIRFATGARAYLFEDSQRRTVAAIWKFDERFDRGLVSGDFMELKLEAATKPEFIDLMGNRYEVPAKAGTYTLPLNGYPVYVRVAADQGVALARALNACEVASDMTSLPLQFSASILTPQRAAVKVINPLSRPLDIELSIGSAPQQPYLAKPNSKETFETKLPEAISDKEFAPFVLPITGVFRGKAFNESAKDVALAVHHVAEGFSWDAIPAVMVPHLHVTGGKPPSQGPAEFAATGQFAWNERNLFMRFVVNDDTFVCPEKGTPWGVYWNYDAIQLFFDSFNDAKENATSGIPGFDTNDFSYELLPDSAASAVAFRRFAPDAQLTGGAMHAFMPNVLEDTIACTFKYEDGKRVCTATFPLRSLMPIALTEGTAFGLGIEVYDRDDPKVGAPKKLSNVKPGDACGNPHWYPQLILTK